MAKTLIIKGANFLANRLTFVSFGDDIPCTAISLDENSLEKKVGDTATLVATPTPSDTTDAISWETSDSDIATVSNGIVTIVGIGSVTITVKCGSKQDTCEITATADMNTSNAVKLAEYRLAGSAASTGGNGVGNLSSTTVRGIIFSSTGTYLMQGSAASENNAHPYKMPNGTTHIKVTVPSGITFYRVGWFNDATGLNYDGTMVAKMIGMDENPTATNNVVQMAIPSYEGFPEIDSLVVSFQKGNNTFLSTDFDNISIEFLHIDAT